MAVRVMIADDSELFADAVRYALEEDPEFHVVGVAPDGLAATMAVGRLAPDVIIMDVQMPVMDGLEAIERIMSSRPTPILVMTADPRGESGELSLEALKRGALDLVQKPMAFPQPAGWSEALRQRLKLLASVAVVRHMAPRGSRASRPIEARRRESIEQPVQAARPSLKPRALGIVASTGGPAALVRVLEGLPADLAVGAAIVQHMSPGFTEGLVGWLDRSSPLSVRLAKAGERMTPGVVWVAPDHHHLRVGSGGVLSLAAEDLIDGHRPSGTALLSSLATTYGSAGIGVVLTGMGADGARGLLEMRTAGAFTIAQDEATSAVYGMPAKAAELGAARRVLPIGDVAANILRLAGRARGSA